MYGILPIVMMLAVRGPAAVGRHAARDARRRGKKPRAKASTPRKFNPSPIEGPCMTNILKQPT